MKGAWILRLSHRQVVTSQATPVQVLRIAADGEETELEKLQIEPGGFSLRDLVKSQLAMERRLLILDLSVMTHLDSSELGEIVSAFVHAGRANGSLVLAGLNPRVRKVIRMMGLDGVIPVFDSVAAAARQFDTG